MAISYSRDWRVGTPDENIGFYIKKNTCFADDDYKFWKVLATVSFDLLVDRLPVKPPRLFGRVEIKIRTIGANALKITTRTSSDNRYSTTTTVIIIADTHGLTKYCYYRLSDRCRPVRISDDYKIISLLFRCKYSRTDTKSKHNEPRV